MRGFVLGPPEGPCGDPLDFACAGPDPAAGTPADYWRPRRDQRPRRQLLPDLRLCRRAAPVRSRRNPGDENLLYLEARALRRQRPLTTPRCSPRTSARVQVPWAIYAGPSNLPLVSVYGPRTSTIPTGTRYRALAGASSITTSTIGELPSVTVVLPDVGDTATSESPGHAVGPRRSPSSSTSARRDPDLAALRREHAWSSSPTSPRAVTTITCRRRPRQSVDVDGSSSDPTTAGTGLLRPSRAAPRVSPVRAAEPNLARATRADLDHPIHRVELAARQHASRATPATGAATETRSSTTSARSSIRTPPDRGADPQRLTAGVDRPAPGPIKESGCADRCGARGAPATAA